MVTVLDQRSIQRKGGICGKYPTTCIIRDLVLSSGVVRPLSQFFVLDLTYGQGIWWLSLPQAIVVAFEIRKDIEFKRRPYLIFYEDATKWWYYLGPSWHFSIVAVDPPWAKHTLKTRPHYDDLGNGERLLEAAEKAAKAFKSYLLIHWKERWVPAGFAVVRELWFQAYHRYSKQPPPSWFGILRGGE